LFYCTFKETGPATYYTDGKQFQDAINALQASGGGDCPELAINGILNGMAEGPKLGSPLYVLTDASAKDATTDNIREVLSFANSQGITINFLTTGSCNDDGSPYAPFEKIASETCGQILQLSSSRELRELSSITGVTLGGTTCLSTGNSGSSNGKKKRSLRESSFSYSIPVDDSTEKIIISVSTENENPSINLTDPTGASVGSGKVSLLKGAIYEINNPRPGTWELIVGSRAGKHNYLIKGSSETNVDFEYFFVMIPTRGISRKPIPISHPLLGEYNYLLRITVPS